MKFEHTPGEWVHNGASCVSDENDNCLFTATRNQITTGGAEGAKTDYADARLIAAAPDMLAALIEVAESRIFWGDSMDRKNGLEHDIKKLIKKATGKSIDEILEGGDV